MSLSLKFIRRICIFFSCLTYCQKMDDSNLTIETYFRGKSIFITGATGFVGKILIEKLLRSFEEIDTIYLLIRQKDDETPLKRLRKLTDCSVIIQYCNFPFFIFL